MPVAAPERVKAEPYEREDADDSWDGDVQPPDDDDGWRDDGGEGEGGGPVRWVTVATFWQPMPAHVARLRLESADVPCLIVDEHLVSTEWLFANAVGGIKLQVPEPDAPRARELLHRTDGAPVTRADNDAPPSDGQALCPRCGGDDLYHPRINRRLFFLSILLLGLPLPLLTSRTRCAECGFEWRGTQR